MIRDLSKMYPQTRHPVSSERCGSEICEPLALELIPPPLPLPRRLLKVLFTKWEGRNQVGGWMGGGEAREEKKAKKKKGKSFPPRFAASCFETAKEGGELGETIDL